MRVFTIGLNFKFLTFWICLFLVFSSSNQEKQSTALTKRHKPGGPHNNTKANITTSRILINYNQNKMHKLRGRPFQDPQVVRESDFNAQEEEESQHLLDKQNFLPGSSAIKKGPLPQEHQVGDRNHFNDEFQGRDRAPKHVIGKVLEGKPFRVERPPPKSGTGLPAIEKGLPPQGHQEGDRIHFDEEFQRRDLPADHAMWKDLEGKPFRDHRPSLKPDAGPPPLQKGPNPHVYHEGKREHFDKEFKKGPPPRAHHEGGREHFDKEFRGKDRPPGHAIRKASRGKPFGEDRPPNKGAYCPSFCLSDHSWFPGKSCNHPAPFCCYSSRRKLYCCDDLNFAIDTTDIGEDYQCPSELVRWWNDWWPVVLGVILSIAMVALVVSVGVCIFQVTKDRRRTPSLRRSLSMHSNHSYHSDCSACQNAMQMDVMEDSASQDAAPVLENGENNRPTETENNASGRTIFIVTSDSNQGHASSKIFDPPPYEEIEPPPAYEP